MFVTMAHKSYIGLHVPELLDTTAKVNYTILLFAELE